MSLFVPFKRATLLIPSGPVNDPDRKHLFVLLTDPVEALGFDGKQVLLVNIASVPNGFCYDSTCILKPGEHRFIKHCWFAGSQSPDWEPRRRSSSFAKREAGASKTEFPSLSLGTSEISRR